MPETQVEQEISPDGSPTGVVSAAPLAPPSSGRVPVVRESIQEPGGEQPHPDSIIGKGEKADVTEKGEVKPEEGEENLADAFNMAKAVTSVVAPKKPEVKAKEEEEEVKVPETQNDPALKKETVVARIANADKTKGRDISDIPEPLRVHFKNMDNNAYNTLKPLFLQKEKEIKELTETVTKIKSGAPPDNYYEHEMGYLLTPEFTKAASNVSLAQQIYQHYETQLNNVRSGAKEYTPLVTNEKGEIVYGTKQEADASAETKLLSLFTTSQNQLMREQGKMESIQSTHKDKFSQGVTFIKEFEDKAFPAFKDENSVITKMAKDWVKSNLPSVFQSNPLALSLAKSLVLGLHLGNTIQEIIKTGKLPDGKVIAKPASNGKPVADARRQPTDADMQGDGVEGGGAKKNGDDITMDDFKAAKAIY